MSDKHARNGRKHGTGSESNSNGGSRTKASSPGSTARGIKQHLPSIAAATAAAALAYLLLPAVVVPVGSAMVVLVRGLVCGAVAGLTVGRKQPVAAAVAGALGASFGFTALSAASTAAPAELLGVLFAAAAAAAISAASQFRNGRVAQAISLVAVLLALLFFTGFLGGPFAGNPSESRRNELGAQPSPNQYSFDGAIYLRTRYLMKQGGTYYASFRQAIDDDVRLDASNLTSSFNYRQPFLFYMWKLLPGALPIHLLYWFVAFGLITMVAAYFLATTFVGPGPALLAPLGMVPFLFHIYWVETWFTMAEVWAGFFGVMALCALARGYRAPSIVLLAIAAATREFMVILIPAWLVAWWITTEPEDRRSTLWVPLLSAILPVAAVGAHVALAPAIGGSGTVGDVSVWFHGGPKRLATALCFGWDFLIGSQVFPMGISLAAIVGTLLLPLGKARIWMSLTLIVPVLFLLVLSSGQWGFYWGAFYTPVAVALMPSIFSRAVPPEIPVS